MLPERRYPLAPYLEMRFVGILSQIATPEYHRKRNFLYRQADPETERRANQPTLQSSTPWVHADVEGELYLAKWRSTKQVPADYLPYQRPQRGRDYSKNPPKTKTLEEQDFTHYRGLEPLLRHSIRLQDKYRLDGGPEATEAWQMVAVSARLEQLQHDRERFRDLTEEDLRKIATDNDEFLETIGLSSPRNPQKIKIKEALEKGWLDSRGRKNVLAADMRAFSIRVAHAIRTYGLIPAVLAKYAAIETVLRYERNISRLILEQNDQRLLHILDQPLFSDPDFGQKPREEWEPLANNIIFLPLYRLGFELTRLVRVKPYVVEARTVVDDLVRVDLPSGSVSRELQRRRTRPRAADFLRTGNFSAARGVIENSRSLIRTVLDEHADILAA